MASHVFLERAVGVEPTTASLEGWDSTAELRPRMKPFDRPSYPPNPGRDGGQARIRTLEDISQQIYSLPPLATWVPARDVSLFYTNQIAAQVEDALAAQLLKDK